MQVSENQFLKPTEQLRNLRLLEEISKNPSISQRTLSQRLGIALGITNACLKRMIAKGISEKTGLFSIFLNMPLDIIQILNSNINTKLTQQTLYLIGAPSIMIRHNVSI